MIDLVAHLQRQRDFSARTFGPGAWRAGYSPEEIANALVAKQAKNESRTWTDWRTMPADKAIEHERIV